MSDFNNPRIMITGVHGFVGSRAMQHYPNAIPVSGDVLRHPGEALSDLVRLHQPDVIINAAAISDIGTCEKNPEESYLANVKLPVVLAKAAKEVRAKFISFSSDQVYTGCEHEGPYREDDILPTPTNLYACHKLEAEQRVLDVLSDAVLLRATWMYDMPIYSGANGSGHDNRSNFLTYMLGAALHGREVGFSSRDYRGITYVRQVVDFLGDALRLPGGVYNYGSENPLNMLETAQAIWEAFGVEAQVQDTGSSRHNLWMDCAKLRKHGICFDTTADGFLRCARDYGLSCE